MQETLLTAARRVVRYVRVDDEQSGGILSIQTVQAVNTLAKMIDEEVKKEKEKDHDRA